MCLGQLVLHDRVDGGAVLDRRTVMTMIGMTQQARGVAVAALVLLMTVAVACGDDATADPSTTIAETVEQYGARVEVECPGGDPGFDPFLAEHPEPTAADWAEFLPAPLMMLTESRDCIVASHPPAAIADDVDAVVAALVVVIDDFEKALAAAEAGDLETTDKWLTQMHDIYQPKIDEAVSRVGDG
jgi:hypothetical protein